MNCEIIKDLLPLYEEKLCSSESAALVEEHIKTCADCKSLLEKLPKTELPKADTSALKPFVKVKRKLRARIVGLISLGVVLLAVLIPVGYLTVNQIFHFNGGTDFESLIYKHEVRQFAEMIVEGRMEEYAQSYHNLYIGDAPDGTSITHRSFYLEKLQAAYEAVKKYDPRVGKIETYYSKRPDGLVSHYQDMILEFTRPDGSPWEVITFPSNYDGNVNNNRKYGIADPDNPRFWVMLPNADPDKSYYEQYSVISEDDIPTYLREIGAFINTLYLADGGDWDIKMIEKFLNKPTSDPLTAQNSPDSFDLVEAYGHNIAIRFAVSDYTSVYNGVADFMRSNCMLYTAIGDAEFDAARNMFYYPVMLTGYDGEHETAIVSVKLYYDEYGLHSPRPKDIEYITGISDLAAKVAGILG